jgi:hypothetical protein
MYFPLHVRLSFLGFSPKRFMSGEKSLAHHERSLSEGKNPIKFSGSWFTIINIK